MKIARYFDAAILKPDMTRQQVADRIRQMVSEMEGDYRAVVKVENSYVSK